MEKAQIQTELWHDVQKWLAVFPRRGIDILNQYIKVTSQISLNMEDAQLDRHRVPWEIQMVPISRELTIWANKNSG